MFLFICRVTLKEQIWHTLFNFCFHVQYKWVIQEMEKIQKENFFNLKKNTNLCLNPQSIMHYKITKTIKYQPKMNCIIQFEIYPVKFVQT